jgi:hypothetical protein
VSKKNKENEKMRKGFILAASVLALVILLNSCYNDKYDKLYPSGTTSTTTCDTTSVSYKTDLMPIITTYCAISGGCHDASGKTTSGYDFTTYADLQTVAQIGFLVKDVSWVNPLHKMPLNGSQIPACDVNKFTAWVDQGAQNN